MSPVSNNFGSAHILRYATGNVSNAIAAPQGLTGFVLSGNRHYSKSSPILPNSGDPFALDDGLTRIDNPDYGCVWDPNYLKGMGLGIGSARSGKGAGLIIPALITYAGSCIVNDPKGDLAWVTGKHREKFGPVRICDPFGSVNASYASKVGEVIKTAKFNPLAHLRDDENLSEELAGITEAITVNPGGTSENASHFFGAARDLIEGITAAHVLSSTPGTVTFRMVRDALTLSDEAFKSWVAEICATYPSSIATKKLAEFVDVNRTTQSVRGTAKEQTRFLDSERLLQFLEPGPDDETFSLSELLTGQLTIYIVLPPNQITTQSKWMRLMINQSLRAVLHTRVKRETPILFLLDEAGTTLGHLKEVENAYGLTSGLGVLCWSFYQDLSQLKRDYPHSWNTFFANSACIQLVKTKDLETSQYFSQYLGQTTVQTQSTSTSKSSDFQLNPGGPSGATNYSQSSGEMGRAVMTDKEIRDLPDTEMLLLYPGGGGDNYRQFKLEYYSDARFNGMYRPDPNDQTGFPPSIIRQTDFIPMEADPRTYETKAPGLPADRQKLIIFALIGFGVLCMFLLHLPKFGLLCVVAGSVAALFFKNKKQPARQAMWWIRRNGRILWSVPPWA